MQLLFVGSAGPGVLLGLEIGGVPPRLSGVMLGAGCAATLSSGPALLQRMDCSRTRRKLGGSFFPQRVVTHWNRLPKEAVDAPSLQAFKARLDVALGSLVCWLATLHIAGG